MLVIIILGTFKYHKINANLFHPLLSPDFKHFAALVTVQAKEGYDSKAFSKETLKQ